MGWFSSGNDNSGVNQQTQTERDNMTTSDVRDHQIVSNFGDRQSAIEHGAPITSEDKEQQFDTDDGGEGYTSGWFSGWFK